MESHWCPESIYWFLEMENRGAYFLALHGIYVPANSRFRRSASMRSEARLNTSLPGDDSQEVDIALSLELLARCASATQPQKGREVAR